MQNAAPRPPPPEVLAPAAAVVVSPPTAPAPELAVVTGAGGWVAVVGAAAGVVGDTVVTAAGAGVAFSVVFGAPVVAPVVVLDEEPLDVVALVAPLPPTGAIEPVGTVNGGLPLVSAVAPPPPPHEATPHAIATPSRTATP